MTEASMVHIKGTINTAIVLLNVFNNMEAYRDIVVNAKGEKEQTNVSCSFGGKVAIQIARNKNRLLPDVRAFEESRKALATELKLQVSSDGERFEPANKDAMKTEEVAAVMTEFEERVKPLIDAEFEADLFLVKIDDLRTDRNRIAISLLQVLDEHGITVD